MVICVRSWRKQETARCIAISQFILIYDTISWREAATTLNSYKYLNRNITIYIGWDVNLLKINLDSVKSVFTSYAFEEIVFIEACLEKFYVVLYDNSPKGIHIFNEAFTQSTFLSLNVSVVSYTQNDSYTHCYWLVFVKLAFFVYLVVTTTSWLFSLCNK